jgi:hypothetical protein
MQVQEQVQDERVVGKEVVDVRGVMVFSREPSRDSEWTTGRGGAAGSGH